MQLFDNELKAQGDAFFYELSPDNRDGITGFDFNDFSSQQGLGFNFGSFSGNGGNGFSFDDFSNSGGDGFSFGNFTGVPDNVPLGNGLLLLAGLAGVWLRSNDKRKLIRN